ncbi:MAG: ATP-binding protein [Dongiaceae bacterium]
MQELGKIPSAARRIWVSTANGAGAAEADSRGGLVYWMTANLAVAAAYYALGFAVGRYFAAYGLFPAPIWLPASVAIVAAVSGGLRLFPGIFLGSFLINHIDFASPVPIAAIISLGNAFGPILCAVLMRRWRPREGYFSRFSGVVVFVLFAVVLHPAITASGGIFALNLGKPLDFASAYRIWVGWWLCDSGGALSFAPTLLLWLGAERMPIGTKRQIGRQDLLVWSGVALVSLALFALPPLPMTLFTLVPFLLVVPLAWIALHTSLGAAYTLASLVSIIAMAGTAAGLGPFHAQGAINALQLAGLLIVLLTMNVLTIVALFCERRAAEEASLSKTMLLANASHDLKTPLNAIIGFADMMRQGVWGPIDNRHYRDYVDNIHASGSLLLNMIRDILDRARIETGKRKLTPKLIDTRPVIETCICMVEMQAKEKQIEIAFTPVVETCPLYADELALRQILLNLLSNAVKFTPPGGRVTIRQELVSRGGGAIEISDTGAGMTEAEQRIALEPFGQVAAASQADGAGLGLPIVARLVELHGGRLSIASRPGKGTTIRVTFPGAHPA